MSFFFHENQQNLIACAIISIREFEEDDLSKMVQSGRKRNSVFTPLLSPHSWSAGEFVVVSRSLIKLAFGRSSNTESVKHSGGALLQILFSLFYCLFVSLLSFFISKRNEYIRVDHPRDNLWRVYLWRISILISFQHKHFNI